MPTELKNQVSLLSLGWVGWVVCVEIKANYAHLELELGLSLVIVAYQSLFRWSHALRSDQNTKNSGLPKLLCWSHTLCSDQFLKNFLIRI